MSRPKILAVDFDGTIVTHMFPFIGEEIPDAIRVLKRVMEAGHQIVLWTCREDEPDDKKRNYLTKAVEWCYESGLKLRSVNENLPSDEFRNPVGLRRKAYADIYIDDRALGVPKTSSGAVDWKRIEKELEKMGWLS